MYRGRVEHNTDADCNFTPLLPLRVKCWHTLWRPLAQCKNRAGIHVTPVSIKTLFNTIKILRHVWAFQKVAEDKANKYNFSRQLLSLNPRTGWGSYSKCYPVITAASGLDYTCTVIPRAVFHLAVQWVRETIRWPWNRSVRTSWNWLLSKKSVILSFSRKLANGRQGSCA